jgi:hypothetical protein
MCPPEESSPETSQPLPPKNFGDAKRRRGHRGGRGRGRGRNPHVPGEIGETEPPPLYETPAPAVEASGISAPSVVAQPVVSPRPRFQSAEYTPRVPRTDGSAISLAVNEVMQVVESLKQTLAQMEEVLELVELAERQKLTDEREIESLLRALRQFQSRGDRPERQNRPDRLNRPQRSEHPESSQPLEKPESPEPQSND